LLKSESERGIRPKAHVLDWARGVKENEREKEPGERDFVGEPGKV